MNYDPSDMLDVFKNLAELKGTIGLVATAIFIAIRLYRLPQWQPSIPAGARWEDLPVYFRYVLIATLAAGGASLAALANGLTWQEALAAGISAALAAITTNKVTKTEPVRAMAAVVVPPKCF